MGALDSTHTYIDVRTSKHMSADGTLFALLIVDAQVTHGVLSHIVIVTHKTAGERRRLASADESRRFKSQALGQHVKETLPS